MAFNPLGTFHKNKRFWMAAILMVCMVTFVFCTGGTSDIAEKLGRWFRRGTPFLSLNGTNYTQEDMIKLRSQRKLANDYMMRSTEFAFRKLTAVIMDFSKKIEGDKDQKRKEALTKIQDLRQSLADRKSRLEYFHGGLKLDDLVEFKLWQLEADRLGIRLEDDVIIRLYDDEMYRYYLGPDMALSEQEVVAVERETIQNSGGRGVSAAFIRRALGEEFRVRIAQEAVLGVQTSSFFFRQRNQNQALAPKTTHADLPDDVRAPMTPAQLWDFFKAKRSEFSVTLLPLHVEDYVADVKASPTDLVRAEFFNAHKAKPFDPSSPEWGLEVPQSIKIEYLIADPDSPAYADMAKFTRAMDVFSPFACTPMQGPAATALRFVIAGQAQREVLEKKYAEASRRKNYGGAALFMQPDCLSPILAFLAKDHPEAGASVVARNFITSTDPFGALAGYLAWGQAKKADDDVVQAAAAAELKRRAPSYALLFATSATQYPLDLAFPFLALDKTQPDPMLMGLGFFGESYVHPQLPLEVVQKEIEAMLVRETAREWAQSNIRIARRALEKADGRPEHFKRDLARLIPELKLTYGPPADKKGTYYDRYSINDAKELAPLKEAFEKYVDMINYAEGRDVAPDTLLKPGDFYKMFFDPTETFSAATSKYHAMPWPPRVKTNAARAWKRQPDPRLIDSNKIDSDPENRNAFLRHLQNQDPNKQPMDFDGFFENAEKPILFWRTDVVEPQRPTDLAKLETDLHKASEDLKKNEQDRKTEKDPAKLVKLNADAAKLAKDLGDLKLVQGRITEGWKLEQARENFALPDAKKIAQEVANTNDAPNIFVREGEKLRKLAKPYRNLIALPKLTLMYPEDFGGKIDYTTPPMPKGVFEYPRADLMSQILGLYDMKKPIKIDYKELDEINKELFDQVAKEKKPGSFVQILTNKPHSVYYIAVITGLPVEDRSEFARSMQNGSIIDQRFGKIDFFIMRAQQQEGRRFWHDVVADFKRAAKYDPPSEEARKNFDDRGGGD